MTGIEDTEVLSLIHILRQVEAMALLKKRGLDFTWLNIGSDTDTALISQIDAAVKKRGLEGRFIRMPAQASPYRFMKNADAVCVLCLLYTSRCV